LKIAFKKVGTKEKEVHYEKEGLAIDGTLQRGKESLVDLGARISGRVEVECIRCGEPFLLDVDEALHLRLSDGVYKGFDEEADVVEFYDGSIDMEEILDSESASIKLDYHICPICKQKEGEDDGSTKETCE